MSGSRSRLGTAAVLAGVLFAAGLFSVFLLPGGGKVTDQQFTDFYNSSGRRGAALLLFFALVAGSWLMAWFFGELRRAYAPGALADFAERAAWLGATATVVGAGVALGPVGVQMNSGRTFVGIPVAHAFDQAGLLILIVGGVYSFALATFLMCLHASRTSSAPRWQTVTGRIIAVLLLASYVASPAMLLPLWAIVVGVTSRRARKTTGLEAELASV
ncbi:MAG TPA: hypothetical protein VF218_09595 [Acidothermaceae bacterium]|jgi:hypothetical protein